MRHVEIALSSSGRQGIEQRLTGRFYTPFRIAEQIAAEATAVVARPSIVGDPFCGDGRLIVAWLQAQARLGKDALKNLRRIVLWDYDTEAVGLARRRVCAELDRLWPRHRCDVDAQGGDTFEKATTLLGQIDVVLTNPPWDLLKPDSRDEISDGEEYRDHLKRYADRLSRMYPGASSAKGKALTGYGVNLARAGAIAALMLAARDGFVGIVLPSSIFADQASTSFRREFFGRIKVERIDWFPAEARLFDGVDQAFVTVVGRTSGATSHFTLSRFDKDVTPVETRDVVLDDPSRPLALTLSAAHESIVAELATKHTPLNMLEADMRYGLWLGRELDETRLRNYLTDSASGVPFLKGKHVYPFRIIRSNVWKVDPQKRSMPATICQTRIAWRDVSRPTQRRRMHVALVPDGNVTGNSLGVAYFKYGPLERICVLLALMNSMVFEIQVRANLATTHVSQGVLRKCTVPLKAFEDHKLRARLLDLVDRRTHSDADLPELEVEVAKAYGLGREEFSTVLGAFPKLTHAERSAHLKSELWP